ncbi:MAG: hypothetical protein RLZZ543_629 [Bacteroidota bacterium]|jgi:hypothetical protein
MKRNIKAIFTVISGLLFIKANATESKVNERVFKIRKALSETPNDKSEGLINYFNSVEDTDNIVPKDESLGNWHNRIGWSQNWSNNWEQKSWRSWNKF